MRGVVPFPSLIGTAPCRSIEPMSFVYKRGGSDGRIYYSKGWGVGYYDPEGDWFDDSVHDTREAAAERVRYLNGGG